MEKAEKNPQTPTRNMRSMQPKCGECKDAGYLGWKTPHAGYPMSECKFCTCETGKMVLDYWQNKIAEDHQIRLDKIFARAGIPSHFRTLTIETMLERCEKEKEKQPAIRTIQSYIENGFIEDTASKRYKTGIILAGDFGRGKTGLLTPVLRHMLGTGKSGLWIETYDFISEIQAGYEDGTSISRLETAQQADVILLDDFGDKSRTSPETDDRRRILYQLINYRHNNGLPMLITTNLTAIEMSVQFGQRTVERLLESCAWVRMGGGNLRQI